MKQHKLIEAMLWLVVMIWAGNYTIGKFGMKEFDPAVFTTLRFAIATPLMLALLVWREGGFNFSRSDLPRLILVGLVGVAIYQTLFIASVKYTTVTTVAMMLGVSPVFTALFGALAGQEKLRSSFITGAIVAFAGLSIVIRFGSGQLGLSMATMFGDILALAAGILWGYYPVLANPLLKKHSGLWATAHSSFFGTIFLVIYTLPDIATINWQAITIPAWASLLYSAIPVTAFSLVAWYYGIEKIGSNQVMIYMFMVMPVAIAIAALTIDEAVNFYQIVGATITMLGVYLVKRTPAVEQAPDSC